MKTAVEIICEMLGGNSEVIPEAILREIPSWKHEETLKDNLDGNPIKSLKASLMKCVVGFFKMFLEDLVPSWEISNRIFEQISDGITEVNPVAILVEIQVSVILGEIPCEIITIKSKKLRKIMENAFISRSYSFFYFKNNQSLPALEFALGSSTVIFIGIILKIFLETRKTC